MMFAAILNEFLIAHALKTRLGGASDSDYENNISLHQMICYVKLLSLIGLLLSLESDN